MSLQIINHYANAITSVCGLDTNQAKTVVYWAIATHAIEKLEIMPILAIMGPHATGKSTLIKIIGQICHLPRPIDGEVSKAELRDKFELNTTALIEEADSVDERLILKRYSRQTSNTSVKRGSASQGWTSKGVQLFGATVLHRRLSFKDPAVDSRSIVIRTSYKQGSYTITNLNGGNLVIIAAGIDWSKEVPVIAALDGRAVDTWMPLCQAAVFCGDNDYMAFAISEIAEAVENLREGQGQEPVQLVISKLIALAWDDQSKGFRDRVALKAMEKGLKEDGVKINSWQVGKALREQGFDVKTIGGNQYVLVISKAQLAAIAQKLGIDDELLK